MDDASDDTGLGYSSDDARLERCKMGDARGGAAAGRSKLVVLSFGNDGRTDA